MACLFVVSASLLLLPSAACAATTQEVLDSHKVTTSSPSGLTMNLFDYWITKQTNDNNETGWSGINTTDGTSSGTHRTLTFGGTGSGTGRDYNGWTPYSLHGPAYEIVQNKLVDGFPKLYDSSDTQYGSATSHPYYINDSGSKIGYGTISASKNSGAESLSYLFDPDESVSGKTSYSGVTGLLQYQNGYYIYDCTKNFASLDTDTNTFDVYDTSAVTSDGMFFPFNSATDVFSVNTSSGSISNKVWSNSSNVLNHYFGMDMTSRFVMPTDGKAEDGNDMIFEFSGDDDVWIYIDGVLVGDLGGNRNTASIQINFATGEVKVWANATNGTAVGESGTLQVDTTLYELYSDALGSALDDGVFTVDANGNHVFSESSMHTLNFYYLERGGYSSNLYLKFNLVEQPASDIVKVDQEGNAVEGATFELYQADENYRVADGAEPIATGTTDSTGTITLRDSSGTNISFDALYDLDSTSTHYRLLETDVPAGYRSAIASGGGSSGTDANDGMALLYIAPAASSSGDVASRGGIVVDASVNIDGGDALWGTGSYTSARELITTGSTIKDTSGNVIDVEGEGGTLFAVVLKRNQTGAVNYESTWTPVWGNELGGFTVADAHGLAGASEAAQAYAAMGSEAQSTYILKKKGSNYTVELDNLPGYIMNYYWAQQQYRTDATDANYTTAIYYTTGSLADATENNTVRVISDGFYRQFSANIYVTNIKNELYVMKVNDEGTALAGAMFTLYEESEVTYSDGVATLNANAVAYDTATTLDASESTAQMSGAIFPTKSDLHKPLETGKVYYLKETSPPDGYAANDTLVKIVVDDTGPHADAGTQDDGVKVTLGVDYLVRAMRQFGTNSEMEATLSAIWAAPMTGTESSGTLTWDAADFTTTTDSSGNLREDLLQLIYSAMDDWSTGHYVANTNGAVGKNGKASYTYETGWAALSVRQDTDVVKSIAASRSGETIDMCTYADLGGISGADITPLYSGVVCVVVQDLATERLSVTKEVSATEGNTAPADVEFSFDVTLSDASGTEAASGAYAVRVFDAEGNEVTAKATTITGGKGSVALSAGQTFKVYGLPTGSVWTVAEQITGTGDDAATATGFPASGATWHDGDDDAATSGYSAAVTIATLEADGSLPAANALTFTNVYDPTPATLSLTATKSYQTKDASGELVDVADWNGATFDFYLERTSADAPLPGVSATDVVSTDVVRVTASQGSHEVLSFGDIGFTAPGTYSYSIYEHEPAGTTADPKVKGASYSHASYMVEVVVADTGGVLEATTTITQVAKDDGSESGSALDLSAGDSVTFANEYDAKPMDVVVSAAKVIEGVAHTLSSGDFAFKLEAIGGTDSEGGAIAAAAVPMPAGTSATTATATNLAGGAVNFSAIKVNVENAGSTYTYKLTEIIPDDAVNASGISYGNRVATAEGPWSKDGITYDETSYTISLHVNYEDDLLGYTLTYTKDSDTSAQATSDAPTFTNTYSVEAVSADANIVGQKTLTGRVWAEGESFSFQISGADAESAGVLDASGVAATATASRSEASSDATTIEAFSFATKGALTFTEPGTYTFNIAELGADGSAYGGGGTLQGVTYDSHTATVAYVVVDDGKGKLSIESVTYANAGAPSETDAANTAAAAFTNSYVATGSYEGFNVAKTVTGRSATAGLFTFTIKEAAQGTGNSAWPSSTSFQNPAISVGEGQATTTSSATATVQAGLLAGRALTQADLGKTYIYVVAESAPSGATTGDDGSVTKAGWSYDTQIALVYIQVLQNTSDAGQLYAVTTIVKGASSAVSASTDYAGMTLSQLAALASSGITAVRHDPTSAANCTTDSLGGALTSATATFSNSYAATGTMAAGIKIAFKGDGRKIGDKDSAVYNSNSGDFPVGVTAADDASASFSTRIFDGTAISTGTTYFTADLTAGSGSGDESCWTMVLNTAQLTQDDVGTYTYTIKELWQSDFGISIDPETYTLTITVTDDGAGNAVASVRVTNRVGAELSGLTSIVNGVQTTYVTVTHTVYGLQINKLAATSTTGEGQSEEASPLAGATFGLYLDESCTQLANYVNASSSSTYGNGETEAGETGTTGTDGTLTLWGLMCGSGRTGYASGVYYLKEVSAPAGYNAMSNVIKLTVNESGTIVMQIVGQSTTSTLGKVAGSSYVSTMTLENYGIGVLPTTGGPGVWPLYLAGYGLLAMSAFLLGLRGRGIARTRQ